MVTTLIHSFLINNYHSISNARLAEETLQLSLMIMASNFAAFVAVFGFLLLVDVWRLHRNCLNKILIADEIIISLLLTEL